MNISALAKFFNVFGVVILGCLIAWAIVSYAICYFAGLKTARTESKTIFVINIGAGIFFIAAGITNLIGATGDLLVTLSFFILWFFTSIPLFFNGKP